VAGKRAAIWFDARVDVMHNPRVMKSSSRKFFNEKLFAGLRSLGVGIALAGSVAVFFGQDLTSALLALAFGLVVLFATSYTAPTGGNDV